MSDYDPPIYKHLTRAQIDLDIQLRHALGWPQRPARPPYTDAELGAAVRAAASSSDGKTEFLVRFGRELELRG